MPDIIEVQLPGVGVRHEFTTSGGQRVAVITHRTGRREILVYETDDPDRCTSILQLEAADTSALAELLGASQVSEAVAEVRQNVAGLAIDWLTVPADSGLVGATIGDGQFRTRTGASIVAVVRGDTTIPAPGPEEPLQAEDVLVSVGTPEGLAEMKTLLQS